MPSSRSARLVKHASVMNTSSDRYAASISTKITCRRVVGSPMSPRSHGVITFAQISPSAPQKNKNGHATHFVMQPGTDV